jgi:hypothetical protein
MKTPQNLLDPVPAAGHSWYLVASVMMVAVTLFVAGYGARYADADAADTAGASCRVCPTCPTCPAYACVCQSYTWLGRFMSAIDEEAQSPDEIRDIAYLAYHESRYTPSAVSSAGAVGICQIKPDAWPDVDMSLLVEDPDYAAVQCLRIYRIYRSKCGAKWYRCYRMGVAGARAAEAASKEKNR